LSKLLLKGGRLIDPERRKEEIGDLLIVDGKIEQVGGSISPSDASVIDISGLIVAPGFIDMHVHLRQPGQEHKETIATGTTAAMRGGFTTVLAMANTSPPIDSPRIMREVVEIIRRDALVNVLQMGTITVGMRGKRNVDFEAMIEAGAAGFSEDGKSVMNSRLMLEALRASSEMEFLISDHCEDGNLSKGGLVNEGEVARRLGVRGISHLAEEVILARDLMLAEETKGRLHVAHVSTKRSVEMIREAKARGINVTAEVTPHHLTLTQKAVLEMGADAKMNPPLRDRGDVEALIEGLRDGTIDAIATDHAPHTPQEKSLSLEEAPFGVIGLETCFPVLYTELVLKGKLDLMDLIAALTINPARILGLERKGRLKKGADGELVLLDLNREMVIDPENFASKGRNTPFAGMKVKGVPMMVIIGDEIHTLLFPLSVVSMANCPPSTAQPSLERLTFQRSTF